MLLSAQWYDYITATVSLWIVHFINVKYMSFLLLFYLLLLPIFPYSRYFFAFPLIYIFFYLSTLGMSHKYQVVLLYFETQSEIFVV